MYRARQWPRLAYNNGSTIFHTRNLIATAEALPWAAAYGFFTLNGDSLPEKRGLALYDEMHRGSLPRVEGCVADIDDAKFFERYEIGESVRRFLTTSLEVIKLLGEDLANAYDLSADTCADTIRSMIHSLGSARLNCMQTICANCNLVSWIVYDTLPGDWPKPRPSSGGMWS
jgi:hypothetical protein